MGAAPLKSDSESRTTKSESVLPRKDHREGKVHISVIPELSEEKVSSFFCSQSC